MLHVLAFTLVIHFSNVAGAPDPIVREAQAEVVDMLHDVGVEAEWDPVTPGTDVAARPDAVTLTLVPYEGGSLRQSDRTIMGVATRTELGTRVAVVFYRRVVEESDRHGVPARRVLACAMAHELGHLLRDAPAHDRTGLMRGIWRESDFQDAGAGRLRFALDPASPR